MDADTFNLIKTNKYKMCPKCKFYVERTEGCNHMTCKCGNHFCYKCGKNFSNHNYN